MPVNSKHPAYNQALQKWERCRDAAGGTDAVKNKATVYLPALEGMMKTTEGRLAWFLDSNSAYYGYLLRALFYPATGRTALGLAGLVFGKPPSVTDVTEAWKPDLKDVTRDGQSMFGFAFKLCTEVLITGRAGVLIDMPQEPGPALQPYWVTYCAESIINWRVSRIGSDLKLTLVVLQESVEEAEPKDFFEPKRVEQYRVLQLINGVYQVSIWRMKQTVQGNVQNADNFEQVGSTVTPIRRGAPLNFIPFIFMGPTSMSSEVEDSPLLALVDVNLSHYRTSADQEHGAHFTALPTPYAAGITLAEGETLTIGAGTAWVFPDPQAKAGMVEFSGAGLEALAKIKEEKRQLMATLGARMLETQKNVQEAAHAIELRHSGERSALAILASTLGDVITKAIQIHLFWRGVDMTQAEKALVKFNPDVMDQLTAEEINSLVASWQAGAISRKTLYYNLEWGEWTRPGVDYDEEAEDIDEESAEDDPTLDLDPQAALLAASAAKGQKQLPRPGQPAAKASGDA